MHIKLYMHTTGNGFKRAGVCKISNALKALWGKTKEAGLPNIMHLPTVHRPGLRLCAVFFSRDARHVTHHPVHINGDGVSADKGACY